MDGIEYGADVYIDIISGEPVATFIKEKLEMRAGETDKFVSVKDEKLFGLLKRVVKIIRYKGIIDIDIFKAKEEYYITEVNFRFSDGYPHTYVSGVNVPEMIINNVNVIANEVFIRQYKDGIYMLKYNEVCILND